MSEPGEPGEPVHLLWTGGWDSTFRLLELGVELGIEVQPYYAYNRKRRSTAMELTARRHVLAAVEARWPEAAARIRPSLILDKDELPGDAAMQRGFEQLRAAQPMGDQYPYLSLLARTVGVDRLEIGINAEDRPTLALRPHLEPIPGYPTPAYRLAPTAPADHAVFAPFVFPLADLTKVDMERRAREGGYLDALELSWFCHDPIFGQACGLCTPCRYTRIEGLGRRIPPVVSAVGGAAQVRHAAVRTRHHAGRTRARLVRLVRRSRAGRPRASQ